MAGKADIFKHWTSILQKELEEVKEIYKIDNIISVSPSTMADDYIRMVCEFSPSEELATILAGFNINK